MAADHVRYGPVAFDLHHDLAKGFRPHQRLRIYPQATFTGANHRLEKTACPVLWEGLTGAIRSAALIFRRPA